MHTLLDHSVCTYFFQQNEIILYTLFCNLLLPVNDLHISTWVNVHILILRLCLDYTTDPKYCYMYCRTIHWTWLLSHWVTFNLAPSLSYDCHLLETMGHLVCRMPHLLDLSACFQFCFFLIHDNKILLLLGWSIFIFWVEIGSLI